MSIQIEETFQVAVSVDTVWRFLLDPHRVVTCMPGAELEQVVDERTFEGAVKIKLGAITTRYRGRIQLTEVDEAAHTVRMLAEGRETGGGTAKGTLTSQVRALPDGDTEVIAQAEVDITGRVMQMGRGMIQGVSSQLFAQFATRTREALETP
ncbi:MAG: SRPBCC family protein, partial [Deltaproteobacteria bacterium]|nr:SRPBCC family protein [Deltaproteobacteria bacterium]